jgi:hypothetical protein
MELTTPLNPKPTKTTITHTPSSTQSKAYVGTMDVS